MSDLLSLLWGTLTLRPYVFAFLAVYLIAATAHLGWRRALFFVPVGYGLAWLSEYASIHWGFPYGDYYYIPATQDRELWVAGVPFMDSLSYVFLSYCSYATALFLLSPVSFKKVDFFILETRALRRSWRIWVLASFLFVLLDIIIDPVAFQGNRWFLGQIYGYREEGLYFGIPMSNFGGWLVVGLVLVAALQRIDRAGRLETRSRPVLARLPCIQMLGPVLYLSVLAFNLVVTFWIGERFLGQVGCFILFFPVLLSFFFTLYKKDHLTSEDIARHLMDFPHSRARVLLPGYRTDPDSADSF
jgi:putative membrane protein